MRPLAVPLVLAVALVSTAKASDNTFKVYSLLNSRLLVSEPL
jgi:hypothetical protein